MMSLRICYKNSLKIYFEIKTPFMLIEGGGQQGDLRSEYVYLNKVLGFVVGQIQNQERSIFLILVFILKKCSKNNYSHEVLAQDGKNFRKKQMISQDLRHPKQKKKNITSQFVPHATTQGQKSAESSLKKCWAIEPKIKISEFFYSQA